MAAPEWRTSIYIGLANLLFNTISSLGWGSHVYYNIVFTEFYNRANEFEFNFVLRSRGGRNLNRNIPLLSIFAQTSLPDAINSLSLFQKVYVFNDLIELYNFHTTFYPFLITDDYLTLNPSFVLIN